MLPFDCANPGLQGVGGGGAGAGGGECPAGTTWYVDDTAPGLNNGMNWTDAFTDLQTALNSAADGDQIWVAEGIYRPSLETEMGEPRSATFAMANCLEIYGGYPNGGGTRDPKTFISILSGDIGNPGDDSDNSYHVVVAYDVDDTAILDGFTITKGQADGDEAGPPRSPRP